MRPTKRRVWFCTAGVTVVILLLLLSPDWTPSPAAPATLRRPARPVGITSARAAAGVLSAAKPVPVLRHSRGGLESGCPSGGFVTISAGGRLGNRLCQYASLWALQRDDLRARPAWLMPEMKHALSRLFPDLALPTLSDFCDAKLKRDNRFRSIKYREFDRVASGPPRRPLLLSEYPCDLNRFNRYREELFRQLTFSPAIHQEAQRRLRQHTAPLCRDPSACTYIGVHVRRTDYRTAVKRMYNGMLAGETYLRRALQLCRRRYRRPVFVVSSDDLPWVRQRLRALDVVIAGSNGAGSAGRDLALLAQCNHTVMTHGTYGFWAAFLARGDVVVPTGFGERDSYLSVVMLKTGFNVTEVPAF